MRDMKEGVRLNGLEANRQLCLNMDVKALDSTSNFGLARETNEVMEVEVEGFGEGTCGVGLGIRDFKLTNALKYLSY
ncbi:conserved hypothetical protein [Ricinus communis]|uniref:Uncharacterized protein n=1 Tax=Ricinus communis TaxID=3988 RepID=B9RI20_RICCO|nr:conserved hypothetical protein [Ricinus communis]